MAKNITFNVKLNVDGKEQLAAATADVKNLRDVVKSMDSTMQVILENRHDLAKAIAEALRTMGEVDTPKDNEQEG